MKAFIIVSIIILSAISVSAQSKSLADTARKATPTNVKRSKPETENSTQDKDDDRNRELLKGNPKPFTDLIDNSHPNKGNGQ